MNKTKLNAGSDFTNLLKIKKLKLEWENYLILFTEQHKTNQDNFIEI